jgi:peptidyl-Asp metalloendopeptidase
MMILYTDEARAAFGGMSAIQITVNLAVTETNQAYANSGINQRIRLVFTTEVT